MNTPFCFTSSYNQRSLAALNRAIRAHAGRAPRAAQRLAVVGSLALLNGCLLTTPYWNQEFEDHTEAVPIQAFTIGKTVKVRFECAKAYHGGLYPEPTTATWLLVAEVLPQAQALRDSDGAKVYGAGVSKSLPAGCWRFDPGNSLWYSAIRATQGTGESKVEYYTFDIAGLECLGRENGKAASWFGWKGCEKSGAKYVIFRAVA